MGIKTNLKIAQFENACLADRRVKMPKEAVEFANKIYVPKVHSF